MKLAYVIALFALGCGDDDGGKMDAATSTADSRPIDAAVVQMDAPPDGPPGTAPLTVKNYLAWCSVSVNGGAVSAASQQVVNVAPGAITLVATALSGFMLGSDMWHHTDGDSGSGEPGTVASLMSTATVTVGSTAKCVWVCCPFTGNQASCSVADQC